MDTKCLYGFDLHLFTDTHLLVYSHLMTFIYRKMMIVRLNVNCCKLDKAAPL